MRAVPCAISRPSTGLPSTSEFDAVWTARTSRTGRGWVVEIAIPWQTLRYRDRRDDLGHQLSTGDPPHEREQRLVAVAAGRDAVSHGLRRRCSPASTRRRRAATSACCRTCLVNGVPGAGTADSRRAGRRRRRYQVGARAERGARRHGQPGLRTGRRRSPGCESDALLRLLPGAAAILPGESLACSSAATGQRFEPFFSGVSASTRPVTRFRLRRAAASPSAPARRAFGALAVSQQWLGERILEAASSACCDMSANFGAQNRLGGLSSRAATTPTAAPTSSAASTASGGRRRRHSCAGRSPGPTTSGREARAWAASCGSPTKRAGATWDMSARWSTSGYDARSGFIVRTDYVRISPAVILDWRPPRRPRSVRRFRPAVHAGAVREPVDGVRAGGLCVRFGR